MKDKKLVILALAAISSFVLMLGLGRALKNKTEFLEKESKILIPGELNFKVKGKTGNRG